MRAITDDNIQLHSLEGFMAAAFLSAGCGGGSDDPPPPAPTPQGFSAIDAAVSSA
jgi:hypothetical protein